MSESPNDERCVGCRFWREIAPTISEGTCRRHPPTASQWPCVDDTEWCGEFVPDVLKQAPPLYPRLLLDECEAGDILGMASNRVTRLADDFVIPSVRMRDGAVGFIELELRAWAAEQQGKAEFPKIVDISQSPTQAERAIFSKIVGAPPDST
jgi:hypothetical protein